MENYLENIKKQYQHYKSLGEKAIEQIDEAHLFWQYNEESNSVAIIVQHLWGNMQSRFTNFLTEDGEKEWRKRDEEFEKKLQTKNELLLKWNEGWNLVFETIDALKNEDLDKTISLYQKPILVYEALIKFLTHYSYHIGQIVFIAKMVTNDRWVSLSIPRKKSQA